VLLVRPLLPQSKNKCAKERSRERPRPQKRRRTPEAQYRGLPNPVGVTRIWVVFLTSNCGVWHCIALCYSRVLIAPLACSLGLL
jgi:hypothetical protein